MGDALLDGFERRSNAPLGDTKVVHRFEGDRFCSAPARRADDPVPPLFRSVLREDETFEPTVWLVLLLCTTPAVLGAYMNLAGL